MIYKITPMLQKPKGKKDGEISNRSWNAPLVHSAGVWTFFVKVILDCALCALP
jgi:hypothetical protein